MRFIWLLLPLFLCFCKSSSRRVSGSVNRSGRGRGISGSLGRGGARATRFTREGNTQTSSLSDTSEMSGQNLRLVGADRQFEETDMLKLNPQGTVKRVTRARRPLQEGAKVHTTRPVGERTVSPTGSGSESFTESFGYGFGGNND